MQILLAFKIELRLGFLDLRYPNATRNAPKGAFCPHGPKIGNPCRHHMRNMLLHNKLRKGMIQHAKQHVLACKRASPARLRSTFCNACGQKPHTVPCINKIVNNKAWHGICME